jgi:hypothetical protein
LAIAAWTVPIKTLVYLLLVTVTLLTITNASPPPVFHKLDRLRNLWPSMIFMDRIFSTISRVYRADTVRSWYARMELSTALIFARR